MGWGTGLRIFRKKAAYLLGAAALAAFFCLPSPSFAVGMPAQAEPASFERETLALCVNWEEERSLPPIDARWVYDIVFNPRAKSANRYFADAFGAEGDVLLAAPTKDPKGFPGVVVVELEGKAEDRANPGVRAISSIFSQALEKAKGALDYSKLSKNLKILLFVQGCHSAQPIFRAISNIQGSVKVGEETYSYRCCMLPSCAVPERPVPLGLVCHEFGHLGFGFDDLYGQGGAGLGAWSVMAYGIGSEPGPIDAYNLAKSGAAEPASLEAIGSAALLSSARQVCRLNGPEPGLYWLLQLHGESELERVKSPFASANEGEKKGQKYGVLILRVDERKAPARVSVAEAHGGRQHLKSAANLGDAGDLWGNGETFFYAGKEAFGANGMAEAVFVAILPNGALVCHARPISPFRF
jgi:hypothetical protein